jgi:hypothetical protein|tara:strand:- start:10583 stop:10825 length:243 start_codon:yes stop_codon:yes gene_type:complete
MTKKKKQLWLRRQRDLSSNWIELYESIEKPERNHLEEIRRHPDNMLKMFCPHVFKRVTGVSLKPGEVRKVKSIKIELGEE